MAPLIPIAMGLAQIAPSILRWLSGSDKVEQVAQTVVDIAATVTGKSAPEALQALRDSAELQAKFRDAIGARAHELDMAFLADVADARRRDIELAKAGVHNRRANWMVALDVLGLLAGLAGMMVLGYVKAKHPDAITEGVFGALLAQLSTITSYFGLCLRDAHQFEFGSSRGSRDKDAVIDALGKK